jgi:membrane associated rhomboid family serine protease
MSDDTQSIQSANIKKSTGGVKLLLALNIGAYLITYLFNTDRIIDQFALHYFQSDLFVWYQFFTSLFLHGGLWHIAINMFVLWMFGSPLESIWGTKKFLLFYLICGLGASLLFLGISGWELNSLDDEVSTYLESPAYREFVTFIDENMESLPPQYAEQVNQLKNNWQEDPSSSQYTEQSRDLVREYLQRRIDTPLLGASGAIYGVLLAFGLIFPNIPIYIYFVLPMKAKYLVILLFVVELYMSYTGAGVGIANLAHLGGMITGFILLQLWGYQKREVG